jgi:hypothetical protein
MHAAFSLKNLKEGGGLEDPGATLKWVLKK